MAWLDTDTGVQYASASNQSYDSSPWLHIEVPVQTLDCGKDRMNRDLYDALKAEEHPDIRYCLESVEVLSRPEVKNGWYRLEATGRLEMAGQENTVSTTLRGLRASDGSYRIMGRFPVALSDFGIDPPTAMMGLIKVRDDMIVTFDVSAEPDMALAEAAPPCDGITLLEEQNDTQTENDVDRGGS
jgi:hypothetical protein